MCVFEAACRLGADEGRELWLVQGCMSIYIMYICVAVVIYLVSFEPSLPLLSRNPNFTLRQEDRKYRQGEREMKNIRGNGNFLLCQTHSAFSTDNTNCRSIHFDLSLTVNLLHCISQLLHVVSICFMKGIDGNYTILYTHVLEDKPLFNRLVIIYNYRFNSGLSSLFTNVKQEVHNVNLLFRPFIRRSSTVTQSRFIQLWHKDLFCHLQICRRSLLLLFTKAQLL